MAKPFPTKCTNVNKIEKVQEGNYDLEGKLVKNIGKLNFLLHLMELIVHGTGVVPIEKVIEKTNS